MLTKICSFLSSNLPQELQIVKELKIIIIKKNTFRPRRPPWKFLHSYYLNSKVSVWVGWSVCGEDNNRKKKSS